jgi:hypothetical protein
MLVSRMIRRAPLAAFMALLCVQSGKAQLQPNAALQAANEQDRQAMLDLLKITSLRPGKTNYSQWRQRSELRRVQGQSLSESARSAEAEEREARHDGGDLVEPAPT